MMMMMMIMMMIMMIGMMMMMMNMAQTLTRGDSMFVTLMRMRMMRVTGLMTGLVTHISGDIDMQQTFCIRA